ncbi:hypothetical protein THAOC_26500 [Thalassiosira oceanica]|uniref:PsbP C-terminal domain-containing protein n=1 Tax=Thalassiosira oceanica TaxID=159749 RepID=K0RL95_THAOC|nr:hypothetical protein THAOC_26500 [Thalassiosira oceanica]|eukprot:EJK53960.1 hypothetical protein THAOC_26500 [Thalassiosira oceanica]
MPRTALLISACVLVLAGAGAFQSRHTSALPVPALRHRRRQPRPTTDRDALRDRSSRPSSSQNPTCQRVPVARAGSRDCCEEVTSVVRRRGFIQQSAASASLVLLSPSLACASGDDYGAAQPYVKKGDGKFQFAYTVTPPASFTSSNKPLKTHLDEINFSGDVRGYQVGVTVDPVRIKSIKEFGDPEQVAARVVTAEVNRDGVFDVKLVKDAAEDAQLGCYDVEYISDGKRGTKRFVTRIYVKEGFLYVLTFQSKEAEYDGAREQEVLNTVKSFKPL